MDAFTTAKYLCEECFNLYNPPNVLPLDLSLADKGITLIIIEDKKLKKSQIFINNCTINKNNHHSINMNELETETMSLDELIRKFFKEQVKDKL